MSTQVCLVSKQAAANLIPALDFELKPEKILLIVSASMKAQADHLESVFKECGIQVERLNLNNEHDFSAIQEQLLEWAENQDQESIQLNLTGGTKLMALAAHSVAHAAAWRVFYVDLDTDNVIWLEQQGEAGEKQSKLKEQLRLRHYLQGYGFALPNKIQALQSTSQQQTLAKTLIMQIDSLEVSLSQLNWLAQQSEDSRKLSVDMDARQQDSRSLEALLRNFSDADVLSVEGKKITFPDQQSRGYVKGGWLEAHVFDVVSRVPDIRDKAANLEVIDKNTQVKNELDVVFMAKNRLFVIECKTARMDKPEAPKANDALFKLADNCRRIGGIGTKGMIVSYRKFRPSEIRLANALNVTVICGADIRNLEKAIKNWIG